MDKKMVDDTIIKILRSREHITTLELDANYPATE